MIFIEDKMNKVSDESNDILFAKYEELENLKQVIDNQLNNIEDNCDEKTLKKIKDTKEYIEETDTKTAKRLNKIKQLSEKEKISKKTANRASEKVIDDHIKKLTIKNKNISLYQKVLHSLKEQIDIDPSRLLALTDGIFGIVMTLLIFGISSPVLDSTSNSQFITSVYAMIPNIGITLVSFILLASFWVYHHQFLKIKKLNMPYLWLNILFLASVSFIPYGTYLVGNYSQFFLANVIFGINILLTILFFLLMYHYANNHGFLERVVSEDEKSYVNHTLYIIMGVTIIVNLLDFNVNHNFIYLFLLVPIISTIRDILFAIED